MSVVDFLPALSAVFYGAAAVYVLARSGRGTAGRLWLLVPLALVVAATERASRAVDRLTGDAGLATEPESDAWAEPSAFAVSVLLAAGAIAAVRHVAALRDAAAAAEDSVEKYRDYAELAADWYWEMDTDERISHLSDRVTQVTGMPPEYFLGKRREEFTSETVAGDDWRAYRRAVDARRPFRDFVYCWKDLDGKTRRISINGKPVFGADGTYLGYRGTAHDETELQETDAARRSQRDLLDSIVENIPSVLFVKDARDLRIVLINKAAEDMVGRPRAEIIGKTVYDLFPREMAETSAAEDRVVLAETGFMDIPEEAVATSTGGLRRMHTRKIALYGEDGHPRYLVRISEDITERMRAEKELRDSKDAAEVASRAKSDFLAMMSHELRTPLNAIIGFSEMMKDEVLDSQGNPTYTVYAADIYTSGLFLLDLIGDLLDLSRIEAGEMDLNLADIDLVDVLDGCVAALKPKIAEKSHTLEWQPERQPHPLRGDATRLRQIFTNLLSNAVKFTPQDGHIRVVLEPGGDGGYRVAVSDNGIGIAKSEQELVFDPFRQANNVAVRQAEGVELGLSITRTLVEMHGGTIALKSAPGVGTTVLVTLPNAEAAARRALGSGARGIASSGSPD